MTLDARVVSTPTPERPCCFACTARSTHSRRDASGVRWHSCPTHQSDLEIMVREVNEWNGVRHDVA